MESDEALGKWIQGSCLDIGSFYERLFELVYIGFARGWRSFRAEGLFGWRGVFRCEVFFMDFGEFLFFRPMPGDIFASGVVFIVFLSSFAEEW